MELVHPWNSTGTASNTRGPENDWATQHGAASSSALDRRSVYSDSSTKMEEAYCNENTDISNCIVGSMDVEALYPSIDVDFSVDRCGDILLESGITFENADYKEIGLFL